MNKIEETIKCPCRWKNCKRHGDCTACKEHHQKVKKDCLPACERVNPVNNKLRRNEYVCIL